MGLVCTWAVRWLQLTDGFISINLNMFCVLFLFLMELNIAFYKQSVVVLAIE